MDRKKVNLLEIVIVAVIASFLSIIMVFNGLKAVDKARIAKMAADTKTLRTAWLTFYSDTGRFPTESDYLASGVSPWENIGPLMGETDVVKNVLNLPGWDGPYYLGKNRSPWLAPYLYDNDNNNVYDVVMGENPYRGVNIGLSELDFQGNVEKIVPAMDQAIDDGNASTGSLRYTPSKRVFYLIHNNQ